MFKPGIRIIHVYLKVQAKIQLLQLWLPQFRGTLLEEVVNPEKGNGVYGSQEDILMVNDK